MIVRLLYFPFLKIFIEYVQSKWPNVFNPLQNQMFYFAPEFDTLNATYTYGGYQILKNLKNFVSYEKIQFIYVSLLISTIYIVITHQFLDQQWFLFFIIAFLVVLVYFILLTKKSRFTPVISIQQGEIIAISFSLTYCFLMKGIQALFELENYDHFQKQLNLTANQLKDYFNYTCDEEIWSTNVDIFCDFLLILVMYYSFYSLVNYCKTIYEIHLNIEKHKLIESKEAQQIVQKQILELYLIYGKIILKALFLINFQFFLSFEYSLILYIFIDQIHEYFIAQEQIRQYVSTSVVLSLSMKNQILKFKKQNLKVPKNPSQIKQSLEEVNRTCLYIFKNSISKVFEIFTRNFIKIFFMTFFCIFLINSSIDLQKKEYISIYKKSHSDSSSENQIDIIKYQEFFRSSMTSQADKKLNFKIKKDFYYILVEKFLWSVRKQSDLVYLKLECFEILVLIITIIYVKKIRQLIYEKQKNQTYFLQTQQQIFQICQENEKQVHQVSLYENMLIFFFEISFQISLPKKI